MFVCVCYLHKWYIEWPRITKLPSKMSFNNSVQHLLYNKQNVLCGMIFLWIHLYNPSFIQVYMSANKQKSLLLHEQSPSFLFFDTFYPSGTSALFPACNVLYINSVEMESLTGPQAVAKAISETLAASSPATATVVHFKVSSQGITLTDNQRK